MEGDVTEDIKALVENAKEWAGLLDSAVETLEREGDRLSQLIRQMATALEAQAVAGGDSAQLIADVSFYISGCENGLSRTPRQLLISVRSELTRLRSEVERLTQERDDAQDRVEELEFARETVSEEFEKDCWKAMQSLLSQCNFDWRDVDHLDGLSAEDAREFLSEVLKDAERAEQRQKERAEKAERERDAAIAERDEIRAEFNVVLRLAEKESAER